MERKKKKRFWKKHLSMALSFALCFSGVSMAPGGSADVKAADAKISIASADELAKIGKDAAYPMSGDYELTEDIDLSGGNWTPIGGAAGPDYALVAGDRVFSGTFDGKGHSINGLTITYNGNASSQKANVSGLFAMIGSDSPDDYAEVKNIVFNGVSISHTLGMADTIGTLTGDANGYVKIDNIAVLSGSVAAVHGDNEDLIGIGGIVGQVRNNAQAVQMTNLYNAASVTVDENSRGELQERCGGILGRIHQSGTIGALSSCVNVGTVLFRGSPCYAINGTSATTNTGAAANTQNITNCFYLAGSGKDMGASVSKTQAELAGQDVIDLLGSDYWEVENGSLIPSVSKGKVMVPIPSPEFAEGDSASSVTKNFTLPLTIVSGEETENINWTSSNTDVVSIDGATGIATVSGVLADTEVTLSAVTSVSGRKKTVKITVRSNLKLVVDQKYAKPGTAMTASVSNAPAGTEFAYQWSVETKGQSQTVSSTASYTPKTGDLNKFITVKATLNGALVDTLKIYCSKLPVVYINTLDGYDITSKEVYKDAVMRVQGNDAFQDETLLYEGDVEIRGRGNSTWSTSYSKRPYKLKLGSKTNLLGFGTSKHWALLANFMDESLIRNTTSYDLAGKMGITPHLKSAHVELILNDVYAGNYQLVGNVRVEEDRVNVFDWEDVPGDVAKAIAKAEGISKDERDALEDYLNEHMEWSTSDSVTYQNKTYKISDYYKDLPKNADGSVNVSGGFLIELDAYYDEVSKFKTTYGQPVMLKSPEFAVTNDALFESARKYIQAVEDSVHAADFYADYEGEKKHYTDLVDMDSLVRYLILNEVYWNTETMKKSTFMYKDLDEKLYIGPVWDMDWTSNSLVSQSETGNPNVWMVTTASDQAQRESWYKYLIGDPYFAQKMMDCYRENRENFEEIIKQGGVIDQDKEYLAESAAENYTWGYIRDDLRWNSDAEFNAAAERLRTFLSNHLTWMDTQFSSLDSLLSSLGKYKASGQISVTEDTSADYTTSYTASVTNGSAAKVAFYINGILAGTADVSDGKAALQASDSYLEKEAGAVNVVQVRAMDASGNLLSGGSVNNYHTFTKELKAPALTGTVTVKGSAKVGSVLKAEVTDTNNTGTLSYQWKADGAAIEGAVLATYRLTKNELGKKITVEASSSFETGSLPSEETEAVTELLNDHVIINQVYGGGNNDTTPVSHSFIELYNPTDAEIDLNGYSVGYLSNGKNGKAEEEVKLALDGAKIPSHHSYLIQCEPQDAATFTGFLNIETSDKTWEQIIDNKQYRIVLYQGTKMEDAVSVNEGVVEGLALSDGTISKQKAIRRKAFADTDNNAEDFMTVEYRDAKENLIAAYKPRSLADGAWESVEPEPDPEPVPDVLSGTVSIRGNAIAGAILYADVALDEKNTYAGALSYRWKADQAEIKGATGEFFTVEKECVGKKISVEVICPDSTVTGTLAPAAMDLAVTEIKAQRDHLIINQVYGDGGKKDVPVSHSFIELYNPTSEEIDLSGYGITYVSEGQTTELALDGKIPSRSSYLVRGAEAKALADAVGVDNFDKSWDLTIGNKQYSVVLKNGDAYVDGVAVNETAVEGDAALVNPAGDEIISKNKAVRRIAFIDTDNNVNDFEVLNYSKLPQDLKTKVKPRSVKDGAWGLEAGGTDPIEPIDPADPELLNKAQAALAEAEGKDASKYEKTSYDNMMAAKGALEDALKTEDAEKIAKALDELKTAIGNLKEIGEITPPDEDKPGEELLAKANQAILEAEKLDASKYDPAAYANLMELKKLLADAVNANSAKQIETALANLQQALLQMKPIDKDPGNQGGQDNPNGSGDQKKLPAAGTKFQYKKNWYKITKSAATGGTVSFVKPGKKTMKTVTVPNEAVYEGIKFRVTDIAKNAFKNNKKLTKVTVGTNVTAIGASAFMGAGRLKTIIIKGKTLKKVGKNALKGVNAKCKIKVPKKQLKSYEKKFKKKGQRSTVKVVK